MKLLLKFNVVLLLVFAVGLRFAYELVVPPDDLFSIRRVGVD